MSYVNDEEYTEEAPVYLVSVGGTGSAEYICRRPAGRRGRLGLGICQ